MIELIFGSDWLIFIGQASYSFGLILAAEIGDKSQLVCLLLGARYRAIPVVVGASLAFVLLNTLAVIFGVAISLWLPQNLIYIIVAVLFGIFGIHALQAQADSGKEDIRVKSDQNLLWTTFVLIVFAELGDKTQIAVVGLTATSLPFAVWLGATLGLVVSVVLGVWAGRTLLQRIPILWLHRCSGILFLLLALLALLKIDSV